MYAATVLVRFLGLTLVVSLICGVGIVLENKGDMDAGSVVLAALVQGFIETVGMLLGG